jgi:hypothetical protein
MTRLLAIRMLTTLRTRQGSRHQATCFFLQESLLVGVQNFGAGIPTSPTEAEHTALAYTAKEAVWIRNFLEGIREVGGVLQG